MSGQICCGSISVVKFGSCPSDFKNYSRGHGFFKSGSQLHTAQVYLIIHFRENFCSSSKY